jgi:hypothetical protein
VISRLGTGKPLTFFYSVDICSVMDRHRFDAYPDLNFLVDADPYPDPDLDR